jgi:CheY-like chemotaxis protein
LPTGGVRVNEIVEHGVVVDIPRETLFHSAHRNPGEGTMETKRNVLVVDDEPKVCTMLRRALGPSFDKVLTATSCSEADILLKDGCVTHLVCDYCLGAGQPLGTDSVASWRETYPSITRAVLFSGSAPESIVPPPEVDAVVSKLTSTKDLLRILMEG